MTPFVVLHAGVSRQGDIVVGAHALAEAYACGEEFRAGEFHVVDADEGELMVHITSGCIAAHHVGNGKAVFVVQDSPSADPREEGETVCEAESPFPES